MEKIKFTYASKSEHNIAQRLIIQTIEKITGKKKRKIRNQTPFYLDIDTERKKLSIPNIRHKSAI